MFLKKATFPFFLLFLKTKKVENYKKKGLKKNFKKKNTKHKRDFW